MSTPMLSRASLVPQSGQIGPLPSLAVAGGTVEVCPNVHVVELAVHMDAVWQYLLEALQLPAHVLLELLEAVGGL